VDNGPGPGMLLGRQTPVPDRYSPQLLYSIPRAEARERLGLAGSLPFYGADLWHAYEISWLDSGGKPLSRVGRFTVPASSPCMVESKSFKLYLNSLNDTRFESEEEARETMRRDVSAAAGADVSLDLLHPADPSLAGTPLEGVCLDDLPATVPEREPQAQMLQVGAGRGGHFSFYSHLLRSLCPVTGQPDWATVWMHYSGPAIAPESLLTYLLAYRRHREFHEQCVERIFRDITEACTPDQLHIQAFYTRRGGLDINPFRSTDPDARPLPRLDRQ